MLGRSPRTCPPQRVHPPSSGLARHSSLHRSPHEHPQPVQLPVEHVRPRTDSPFDASQYQYPSYQGTDSQQASGYQYPQYGQPYQASGAASPDGYGSEYQGQYNPQADYRYPQNQSPAGAASYGYAQPDSSHEEEAAAPTQEKKRSLATTVLTVLAVLAVVIYAVVGGSYDFGTERLIWTGAASGLGLIVAIGCLVSIPLSFRELRRAKAAGDIATRSMRVRALFFAIIILPLSGYFSVTYGVPAAQDLVEGHHTVTVTSCTYEQGSHRKSRRRGRGRTVFDNYFTMTLADGTLHTTTIETDQPASIQTMGGTYEVLYQACKVQSGSSSMTLDVYEHSWIIVDARLN